MASDDLFFQVTGDETEAFVLITLTSGGEEPQARAEMAGPAAEGLNTELPELEGSLIKVLRDGQEYAMLNGLGLRIDLNGNEWPDRFGILGN
jgi:hypothetical protein